MSNRRPLRDVRGSAGFTLMEMMLMVSIMGILMSMAVLQISQSQPVAKSDGAMRIVLAQFNSARELAITQRRFMRLSIAHLLRRLPPPSCGLTLCPNLNA